jgi:hypothetical protein
MSRDDRPAKPPSLIIQLSGNLKSAVLMSPFLLSLALRNPRSIRKTMLGRCGVQGTSRVSENESFSLMH